MPSRLSTPRGSSVTSAPVSMSNGTSVAVAPVRGSRRATRATGAGGAYPPASYVGIGTCFGHLLLEVGGLFGVNETGRGHADREAVLGVEDDHEDPRVLRQ